MNPDDVFVTNFTSIIENISAGDQSPVNREYIEELQRFTTEGFAEQDIRKNLIDFRTKLLSGGNQYKKPGVVLLEAVNNIDKMNTIKEYITSILGPRPRR